MNLSVTRAEGWSSDGTACTVLRLEVGETGVPIGDMDGREIGDRRYGCGVSVKQGHKKRDLKRQR